MGFLYYMDPLYLTVAVISMVIMLIAQVLVKSRFSRYSKVSNSRGMTGRDAAEAVLHANGVTGVSIERCKGSMTDHYDPRSNVIRLSEAVYDSCSIAAVGVAAHEAGHAVQYAENYFPIRVRTAILPLAQHGPMIGIILMFLGAALSFFGMVVTGLVLFGMTFLFQFATLPVEFNASHRALKTITEQGLLNLAEYDGAKNVLTAAALTYVAAMIQSLLTLLYYAVRLLGNNRRN